MHTTCSCSITKSQYYKVCMISMCKHKCINILAYTVCKLYSQRVGGPSDNSINTQVSSGNMMTCWSMLCSFASVRTVNIHWTVKSLFYIIIKIGALLLYYRHIMDIYYSISYAGGLHSGMFYGF